MPRSQIVGKVAIVTGATQGIGKGIALRLAEDGYDVAINDIPRNQAQIDVMVAAIKALGRRSVGVPADVSSSDACDTMVATVVATLGRLDCMVANAGICHIGPLLETTEAERKAVMDVNCLGLFNQYIAAAKQMVKQGEGGRILGAASITAFDTAPIIGTYSASKWAVKGFTQVAAKEWGKHGIRVNCYCPGVIDTPMWDIVDAKLGKEMGLAPGEARAKYVGTSLLGRLGAPSDIAKLVSFLASDDAEYITGQSMVSDGGMSFA
ncbi:hypothetical protein RQP46_007888 [Phenoliferia psychrophenolica]